MIDSIGKKERISDTDVKKDVAKSFGRKSRLLTASQYTFVFNDAKRFGNASLTVLARENKLGYARLGLAISKKCAKRAVDRNLIKRVFRESFRLNQHSLPSVDIIAMCKPSAVKLEKVTLRHQIDRQWFFMINKFSTKQNNHKAHKADYPTKSLSKRSNQN